MGGPTDINGIASRALATEIVADAAAAFAALAEDIEDVVNRLAAESELDAVSQKTADDVRGLLGRAHQLCDARLALVGFRSSE